MPLTPRDRRPTLKREQGWPTTEAQICQPWRRRGPRSVSNAVSLFLYRKAGGVARRKLRRVRESVTAGLSRLRVLHTGAEPRVSDLKANPFYKRRD